MKSIFLIILFCALNGVVRSEDLILATGKVYKDFQVMKVEPDGLRIMHSSGMAKILHEELPKEIKEKYSFDAEKAEQYRLSVEAATKQTKQEYAQRVQEMQRKKALAEEKVRNTPRLTQAESVKGAWLRALPRPTGLDPLYSKKLRFCNYMSGVIQRGDLDLEAQSTALQWNISEYRRVGQNDNALALSEELSQVRKAIEKRDALRQQAEIAAMEAELQAAQIRSLNRLGDALNNVAFSLNNGIDVYLWDMN